MDYSLALREHLGPRPYQLPTDNSDELFRLPIQRFADARADAAAAPTFRHEFQWNSTADPAIRAGHSFDTPLFFHTPDVLGYTGPHPPVASPTRTTPRSPRSPARATPAGRHTVRAARYNIRHALTCRHRGGPPPAGRDRALTAR